MPELHLQQKQIEFLCSSADIVIGGGAAGGGKTYSLVVEPLRHALKLDNFNAVIFRRSYPEITRAGGVWDEATKLYPFVGGVPNGTKIEYTFGTSRVGFGYLSNEQTLMEWKSSQIALIEFDQLETFTERMFFYMLSRNRSTCGIKSYVRATANPEPNWLADFLDWWIAPDGYANIERAGKIRAFIRHNDEIIWGDSKEELSAKYPDTEPKTVTFIPFTIYDNTVLMDKDPGYLSNLKALPMVDRERLLGDPIRGGNWKIKPSTGKVFNREWFEIVEAIPDGGVACRYFDYAGTAKKYFKDDPDYTAGVLMVFVNGNWYVTDLYHKQVAASQTDNITDAIFVSDAERMLFENRRYLARWEIEPGSASLRDSSSRTFRLAGIDARGENKRTDKVTAWRPLSAQAEAGHIKLLKAPWNEVFLNQLHGVPDLPHDDIADAASGAYSVLQGGAVAKIAISRQG